MLLRLSLDYVFNISDSLYVNAALASPWELVRNANSWTIPTESEALELGTRNLCF